MSWLRKIQNRFRALFQKEKLEGQMDDEMRSHIEMQTQENIEAGMNPGEAHYAALREFGWIESIKESCREQRGVNWIGNFGQDIWYGGRMLLKNPGYTFVAVLTLALGIGANTALFSIINAVLLRPLPFSDPQRLVMVWQEFPKRGSARESFSLPNFIDLRRETKLFAGAGSFTLSSHTLTGVDEPARLNSIRMSAGLIPTLGVRLALGRNFREEEDRSDADRVALLSDHLWRRRFGSDPGIIGRTMGINDEAVTIVGVLPKTFRIGEENPDICLPLRLDPAKVGRGQRGLQAIARLKPGVKVRQMQPELNAIAARLRSADPWANADMELSTVQLHEQLVSGVRLSLLTLGGAVVCVLLIACANVANLSLARGLARQSEMTIRAAIGAGRGRIVRQLLTESLMLSVLGGGLGLIVGRWGLALSGKLLVEQIPQASDISFDPVVLTFTFAASILSGVLFGVVPALSASGVDLAGSLKEGTKAATSGKGRYRLRGALVAAEVGLAFVLLTSAGLLLRSLGRLRDINPGFDSRKMLAVQTTLSGKRYNDNNAARLAAVRGLVSRLESFPGVEAVTFANSLPLATEMDSSGTAIEGRTFAPNQYPFAHIRGVGGNYFQTLRVPLLDGRHFTEADNETAQKVVVINATMARQFWAQESAIGKRLRPDALQEKDWLTTVGVVADMKNESLAQPPRPEIYYLYAQYPTRGLGVMLRTAVPPITLAETVRREIWRMDSSLAITSTQTMEQVMRQSSSTTSFQSLLLGIFAGLALLLAAIGIYSVLSCAVGQRSREIGIRMALGARTGSVYALILSGGMKSVLVGIGIGLVGAIFSTRFIARLLFETSATDSVTLISVALLLASTALAACFFPARRAAKVDPMVALRYE